MFKTNAQNNIGNAYVDRNDSISQPGTRIEANDQNIKQQEMVNLVESSGQTLDVPGDFTNNDQVAIAAAIYGAGGAEYCIDTGSAGAYVLTPVSPKKSIPAYFDGMTLSFKPGTANPGACTVNYNSLGVIQIRDLGDSQLTGGEIVESATIRYNGATSRFELLTNPKINIIVISASTTYNPPAGVRSLLFLLAGSGAGSGGADGQGVGTAAMSAGGGGGAVSIKLTTIIDPAYTIVIGVGGAAGLGTGGTDGGDGGDTTLTSASIPTITAGGGLGGDGMVGNSTITSATGGPGGSNSGPGDLEFSGGDGTNGAVSSGERINWGDGGGTILGPGRRGKGSAGSPGNNGINPGEGGGGAGTRGVATNSPGGTGADGILIIVERY